MVKGSSETKKILEQALERYPIRLSPETLVIDAIAAMSQASASYILIVSSGKLLGIFTEHELVKLTAREIPLEGAVLAQVMIQNVITVTLEAAGNLYSVLTLLRSSQLHHLPILDGQGKLLGVITLKSLWQILKPTDFLHGFRIGEMMVTSLMTAPNDASVFQVTQQMANAGTSCVVICAMNTDYSQIMSGTQSLKPVGIVTAQNIVKFRSNQLDLLQTTVEKVMNPPLNLINQKATLWEAYKMMQQQLLQPLVVVDEAGYLAGLLTQTSILSALPPVEVHTTVEILQETVVEKTQELRIVHEQMEQGVMQRKQVEEELRKAQETLEEQVQQRTLELTKANARLKQEIQERIAAEAEIRRLNAELEQRVQERTALLTTRNQELQQEIRERMLLEEKLHISESKMRAVFEAMTDIIIVLDTHKNIEVLPTNMAVLYQPNRNIVDRTIELLFENEKSEDYWRYIQKVLETQEAINFDYCLSINEGYLWFTACISPLSHNTAIWVARDISSRKRAESELRQKNAELATALQELTLAQKELIHSEKMAALGQLIAGIAHEINTPLAAIRASIQNITEFLFKNLEELPAFFQQLSPEHQQEFFALLNYSTQYADTLSSKETRCYRKALQSQLKSEGFKGAESLACTLVDIGIRGEIEPFFSLLKTEKSQEILQVAYQFSTLQRSTKTIAIATERAAKIVFALKNYAHHDSCEAKKLINIIDGIETVLILYQNYLKQGVEVLRNYQQNLPLILCYPDELNQVWTNLIHNALQAMENQGVLQIEVKQQGETLQIRIADSGKGIMAECLPHIFEPFFTTKPPGEGSGLGLNIVKKVIEKHQGKIEVASVPGNTAFTVILPC